MVAIRYVMEVQLEPATDLPSAINPRSHAKIRNKTKLNESVVMELTSRYLAPIQYFSIEAILVNNKSFASLVAMVLDSTTKF